MSERKRFQNQTLNSEDYEKIEKGAKAVKEGSAILATAGLFFGVCKKYGPSLLKNIKNLRK